MQDFRSLCIYSEKDLIYHEDRTFDRPTETGIRNRPPHREQTGERASAQTAFLGMYLAL